MNRFTQLPSSEKLVDQKPLKKKPKKEHDSPYSDDCRCDYCKYIRKCTMMQNMEDIIEEYNQTRKNYEVK